MLRGVFTGTPHTMIDIEKTVLVQWSPAQMFQLVESIENYPLFLPWCADARVEHRDERTTRATLFVDYHRVRVEFSTENTKRAPDSIDIRLLRGPFRHLDGRWRFMPLGETACKVSLRLSYEFSNRVLDKLVGPVFGLIAGSLVDAFVCRAEKVYAGD